MAVVGCEVDMIFAKSLPAPRPDLPSFAEPCPVLGSGDQLGLTAQKGFL